MIGDMFLGILFYLGFKWYRAYTSGTWDKSNLMNLFRYEAYHGMYPGQHAKMVILTDEQYEVLAANGQDELNYPYGYVGGDEFSDHFPNSRA
jgi:hypothetical protein